MIDLLFNLFRPWEWSTSEGANVIQVLYTAITAGILAYAFYRNRQLDRRINDLAEIARELKRQNEITQIRLKEEAAPHFEVPNIQNHGDRVIISIPNTGKKAKIGKVQLKTANGEELDLLPKLGAAWDDEGRLFFHIIAKNGKQISGIKYRLQFEYTDIYENLYAINLNMDGAKYLSMFYDYAPLQLKFD